ncbi:MAG: hypothetical protein IKY51_05575 [Alistipes sp.]|nr:hypothetical protein [Alistipes sp.]
MDKLTSEICNDCLHRKGSGYNIICSLTGKKPNFGISCEDFVANNNEAGRYIMKKHMCKDEYESKGNAWLCSGSCVSIALFVFGAMISINAEKYTYIYLLFLGALAIIALSVCVYVSCRSKMHAIDMDIAEFKAKNREGAESQQGTGAKHKENIVTIDRIIRLLRDMGYNSSCESSESGIKWIRVLYGENNMFIAYVDKMLQVYCPFSVDESTETSAFVYNFLLAANAVMINKRFVQITGDHGECRFVVSGYVRTMDELSEYLPNYLSIINESVTMHRHYFRNIMQENAEAAKRESAANDGGVVS